MGTIDISAAEAEAKERLVRSLQTKGAHLPFEDAVKDFPERLINEKPSNVPYTFWHQIEHIRICQWDILEYVKKPDHTSPSWPAGYWPDPAATAGKAAWDKSIEQYYSDRKDFVAMIQADNVQVLAPVQHNNGRSIMGSVLIVVDHNAYHLGEFVMGRQILGAWQSALA